MKIELTTTFVLLSLFAPLSAADLWKTQFFYDKDRSSLEIRDLQCPSANICVAAALLSEQNKNKPKGTLVVTSDAGEHWQLQEVNELPYSLFFLNETTGWMVTDRGVWFTQYSGKTWKKVNSTKGLERLWFLDASHGFAVGEEKSIYETTNAGKDWTKREVKDPRPMEARDVVFDTIAFASPQHGVISGSWNPMQRAQEMEWLEMNPAKRPKTAMSALLLESSDGGKEWRPYEVKIPGRITQLRFLNVSSFAMLVEYLGAVESPSELFQITAKDKPAVIFHRSGLVVRNFVVLPGGEVVLAAVELMGKSSELPIPGKLHMIRSSDLKTWQDETSDYRAEAKRTLLAAPDAKNVWVATDTGMILKRVGN